MKLKIFKFAGLFAVIAPNHVFAVEFTKEELELAKGACLAGSNFEFKTEADGSISVKNLEGKGKFIVSKKDVTTVDLPDSDKADEFKEIRSCIRSYLTKPPPAQTSVIILKDWDFLVPHDGNTPSASIREVRLVIDNSNPVVLSSEGFAEAPGAWGFKYSGVSLNLSPVEHSVKFEFEYSVNDRDPPWEDTTSCTTILSGSRSAELTPKIHAEFEGYRLRIKGCSLI